MAKNVSQFAATGKPNRFKIKGKSKFPPGIVKFQVLGSGANGAPRCLYLFTDHSRYIFNCGEGTQRLAHEHKMKLSKLEHVFITHSNWLNIGGLPGLALTVQDVGVPNIELHGPQGIEELFYATKRFVVLRDLKITASESDPFKPFEDNAIIVNYIPLISNKRTELRSMSENSIEINNSQTQQNMDIPIEDETNYYDYENIEQLSKKDKNKRKRSNSEPRADKKQFIADSSINRINNVAMSYICRLKPKPGFLDLDECVKHNVPPGPLLGLLKSGKDITLSDGKIVKSSDVTSPDDPGPVFIVIECPSEDYIDSLLNQSVFSKHQQGVINEDDIAFMVVHFTPQEVRNDPRYISWMNLFPPKTYHLLLNNENKCLGSTAIHRIQYKLNMLDEHIYPLLKDKGIPIVKCDDQVKVINATTNINSPVVNGETNLTFNLRPKMDIDRTSTLSLDVNEFIEETFKVDGFKEKLAEVKKDILNASSTDTNTYPKITFLGTGSCIPSKTRNTSGILMYTGENECVLLDSGEGTYGQLVRHFGITGTEKVLSDLKAIYVSHLHADHHIGLIGILSVRQKMRLNGLLKLNPVYLLAPVQIMTWLNFYHRRFIELNEEFQIVSNSDLDFESSTKIRIKDLLKQTNMSDIETTLVKHCPNAYGVSFIHTNGWKVTYSGDTMPCDSLVKLGKNSNLLIHEATMEDQLVSEARRKMHSTMSQAINIGRKMNAKFTILTHFSQRYAKIPYMANNDLPSNVGIAFDNMEIAPNCLHKLPLMYPALKMIFAEHFEEMEAKCFKLKLKEEKALSKM